MSEPTQIERTVVEGLSKDVGRAVVRLDPADFEPLGVGIGDTVAIEGNRLAYARVMPAYEQHRGKNRIQMAGIVRDNAGSAVGETVCVAPAETATAREITLHPAGDHLSDEDIEYIAGRVDGLPVQPGDRMRIPLLGSRWADFRVGTTDPAPPVLIDAGSRLVIAETEDASEHSPTLAYEDIGGLGEQVHRIRETVELPLRKPELFERVGIDAPAGVLMHGPPGCGKTLLARTIASEGGAAFFSISGPEIIDKYYGESEKQLRALFEEASKKAPSIVFIDEIDAIAPKRHEAAGDVERRVVATLLALMDGLEGREQVIVLAATNRPDAIDPALRRPGRFDRELPIPIPDRQGRREILSIHSRGMPLAEGVDLDELADLTHGYVGADLEALCREAAMAALRGRLPDAHASLQSVSPRQLRDLAVDRSDFLQAYREIQPAAIREVFVEIPSVGWEDVGGLPRVKQRLVETVEWPLSYPDLFDRADVSPARGILLAGPPGCGKTLLARAAASQMQVNFISIKAAELLDKYIGESEQNIRTLFDRARQAAPCIVFFDEIDALAASRSTSSDRQVESRVLAQLLTELDGIEGRQEVLVLAATNRRDRLDPALLRPGRFDEIIEVPRPDREGRREILEIHLRDKPVDDSVDLDQWADRTDAFSGSELAEVCRRAGLTALRRCVAEADGQSPDPDGLVVTEPDLTKAVSGVKEGPSGAPPGQ